jgi:hypothetical protein
MNEINKQVSRAKRRLITGRFFRVLTWSMFAGLLLAAVGMTIPKIWHLGFLQTEQHHEAWIYSWVVGGMVLSLLVAAYLTITDLSSPVDVAVEVDRRFGLKERLSSAMSLSENDLDTESGQALVEDAVSRAETIDVRDKFQYQLTWRALLPLIPAAIMAILLFVPNATEKAVVAKEPESINRKKVEMAIKEFKKKAEKKRKELTALGLEDASKELKSLEKKFDELLEDKNKDKKNTLVKLNDIKKAIEDRRKELGSSKDLKENLNKLKDMKSGPAKEITEAMAKGDMKEAQKAIKDLIDKLKEGKLNDIEKKQLAKDLEQIAKELKKIADKHEQEKQDLKDKIKKAIEEGDLDKAAELQQKLEQKQQQDKQKQKMKEMAQNLQKCANCMKPGNAGNAKKGQQGQPGDAEQQQAMKEAGEALEDLAEQMEQMEKDMAEMEALEDMESLAGECKGECNGEGAGGESDKESFRDWAKGAGRGHGKRSLEEEKTGNFKSRVNGKLQKGQTVVTGNADGKNITGRSSSEVRDLIQAEVSKDSDPLQDVKLPKAQMKQGQQYFNGLRRN